LNPKNIFKIGAAFCAALLVALSGCVSTGRPPPSGGHHGPPTRVELHRTICTPIDAPQFVQNEKSVNPLILESEDQSYE
jgi:hypothetical protein